MNCISKLIVSTFNAQRVIVLVLDAFNFFICNRCNKSDIFHQSMAAPEQRIRIRLIAQITTCLDLQCIKPESNKFMLMSGVFTFSVDALPLGSCSASPPPMPSSLETLPVPLAAETQEAELMSKLKQTLSMAHLHHVVTNMSKHFEVLYIFF